MLERLFAYENGTVSLAFIITAFVAGAIIASAVMLREIKVPGRIIRTLDKAGARSPESAIPAKSFGFTESRLRRLLRPRSVISKYVRFCSDGLPNGETLCYLAPESADSAVIRYDGRRASPRTVIVGSVLLCALGVAMYYIIPNIEKMLNNLISMF